MLLFIIIFFACSVSAILACQLNEICQNEKPRFENCTSSEILIGCEVKEIPLYSFMESPPLNVKIPKCLIKSLRWQSIFSPKEPHIDLSNCDLECNCINQYMFLNERGTQLTGIEKFTSTCGQPCPTRQLVTEKTKYSADVGDQIIIEATIEGEGEYPDLELQNATRQYFKWSNKATHNHEEEIVRKKLRLIISNVTEDDIGVIIIRCWHCADLIYKMVEVHIDSDLMVKLEDKDESAVRLEIIGHPLVNLSISVAPRNSSVVEERQLPQLRNTQNEKLFDGMILRQDTHSTFYHRIFDIFLADCPSCHQLHGEYQFKICNAPNQTTSLLFGNITGTNTGSFGCRTLVHTFGNFGMGLIIHILVSLSAVILPAFAFFLTPLTAFGDVPVLKTLVPTSRETSHHTILIVVLLLLFAAFGCGFLFYFRRPAQINTFKDRFLHRQSSALSNTSHEESEATQETMLRLEEQASLLSTDYSGAIITFLKGDSIKIHEKIGTGAFGSVYCGSWDKTGERSIAMKAIEQADAEIEKEASVLCRLDHPNIVRLYGIHKDNGKLLLVFEMMNRGDLRSYLRGRAPPLTSNYSQFPPALMLSELKSIIAEIVKGVRYLGAQQIVHRDLAARNCLVSGDSDIRCCSALQRPPITIKISDFGMSRRLTYQADYYRMQNQSLLPVRWLPPEAISQYKFSHYSDIWALGVTMWEVYSYGQVPFESLSNHEIVSYAIAGMRPPKPRNCPIDMYSIMEKCWALEPEDRISAEEILLHPYLAPAQAVATVQVSTDLPSHPLA